MKKPRSRPLGDSLDLRYVTERRNKDGKLRRYWQRPGHKLTRLPDGPEYAASATYLNRAAETQMGVKVVAKGTVNWAIERYKASDDYKDKAQSTKDVYLRWLNDYEVRWGALPCGSITRRVIVEFLDGIKGRPTKIHAAAVLRNVLGVAHDAGIIKENPCFNLKIGRNKPRQAIWDDEAMEAFRKAARGRKEGDEAELYMWLLLYTGQRPIDCCNMLARQYNGDTIRVRQQKTQKLVEIPCHAALRAKLEQRKRTSLYILSRADGRPWKRGDISYVCMNIRAAAGLTHLQMRDFRRTAAVRLAEAGCTVPEIAAITGHSIERTQRILEVYLPRTLQMGRAAILKWENKQGEKSNALEDKGR